MARIASLIGGTVLLALLAVGTATSWTPAHAVTFGEPVPEGLCPAYAAYRNLGHPEIEVVERVCPVA